MFAERLKIMEMRPKLMFTDSLVGKKSKDNFVSCLILNGRKVAAVATF